MSQINARVRHKRDTSSNWTSQNPVLLDGEIIIVDTDSGEVRFKIGDGVKTYTQLPFQDESARSLISENAKDIGELEAVVSEMASKSLLREDGIIKQEHLPEGYPYAEPVVFLPETEAVYSADMEAFAIISGIDASMFTDGESYTVNWNGSDYETKALLTSYDGMNGIALGDVGILQGAPTTGEPFMIAVLDADSQAATGVAVLIVPIDGSASVTLSISGDSLIPIARKFLPKGYPYFIPGGEVLMEEQSLTNAYDGTPIFTLTEGFNYTVNWNGTAYLCTANILEIYELGSIVYIGDGSMVGGEQSDEPFVIAIYNERMIIDGSFSATVSVVLADSYKKIDERYLPDIAKAEDLEELQSKLSTVELSVSEMENIVDDVSKKASSALSAAYTAQTTADNKLDKSNPTGTGSFSLNRKIDTTIGNYSQAEGHNNTASAYASHAEGADTVASGSVSHAEGDGTTASGPCSHAEGEGTIASGSWQHVQGKYNIEDTTDTYAHIVGNGYVNRSSNAHTLDWDGNAWFAGDVYVGGTSQEDATLIATTAYVDSAIKAAIEAAIGGSY